MKELDHTLPYYIVQSIVLFPNKRKKTIDIHLCHLGGPNDKRPYDMQEPNFFGISIGFDPYMDELIDAQQKSNGGGDGGCNFCGGTGITLAFLPCSPHYKPNTIYSYDDERLNGDYDFYRSNIRIN